LWIWWCSIMLKNNIWFFLKQLGLYPQLQHVMVDKSPSYIWAVLCSGKSWNYFLCVHTKKKFFELLVMVMCV
jgi:hypothetical protein